jgi:regulator of nucleoside diphosphate kinase
MTSRTIVVTDRDFGRLSALMHARTDRSIDQARDQAHLETLEEELARSSPTDVADVPEDVVTMHSRVNVRDLGSDVAQTYTLVFPDEADLPAGRLSVLAPLGTALLGYRAGDTIEWTMPGGVRHVHIESVRQPGSWSGPAPSRIPGELAFDRKASVAPFDGAAR